MKCLAITRKDRHYYVLDDTIVDAKYQGIFSRNFQTVKK